MRAAPFRRSTVGAVQPSPADQRRRARLASPQAAKRISMRALLRSIAAIGTPRFSASNVYKGSGQTVLARALADTHERIETERDALRRFASDAAHQLRTPLAVLAARMEAPESEWDAERMRGDLRWMERLVDQLLASSRTGTTQIDADCSFDLPALVHEVASALAPLTLYRGRDIELIDERGEAAEPACVLGAHALAHEALSNLVENALDHAPHGSTVTLALSPCDDRVEVRDRGSGVPPSERERVFERFAQGHRPTTGGAGLGLSIVADIMRRHRGEVSYRDREGGGAVFALQFVSAARHKASGEAISSGSRMVRKAGSSSQSSEVHA